MPKFNVIFLSIVIILLAGVSVEAKDKNWKQTLGQYQCLEVQKFHVDRNNFSTVQLERAASIPEETLKNLQRKIAGQIFRDKTFPKVVRSDTGGCEGKTLILKGDVAEYKKGNRAARVGIGYGAGKQKISVKVKLVSNGKVIAAKKVVDRKFGGLAGGDEAKGERDFAEKVAKFVKQGS